MRSNFRTQVYVLDQDGEEHEVEVRIEYEATYEPEHITGLPENCYPATSEMELIEVNAIHDLPVGITDDMVREAAELARDCLTDEAWEDYFQGDV
jgi:hypothetical protein